MHDIKAIRDNPEVFDRGWALKGLTPQTPAIMAIDAELRAAQTALQAAQSRRNNASKMVAMAMRDREELAVSALMVEVEHLKARMAAQTEIERERGEALRGLLAALPNLPADDVPPGADESGNVEVRRWGEPRAIAAPKDHVDLGQGLGLMDFEAAARMSGARFVVLKGALARLERALGQFMLDIQTLEHGYQEISPPLLVHDDAMFGTGQLPKFEDDLFQTFLSSDPNEWTRNANRELAAWFAERPPESVQDATSKIIEVLSRHKQVATSGPSRRWLIPTAEVALTNLVRQSITDEGELPLRLTALTHCFRSEAGASGRDTRGMIRQHQFQKVELVSITTPEQSAEEHERMVACAETVLKRLELPFRTMLLCAGDMGFGARKTYDLEVWLPSQATYREISSCSNCGDFQARRMDARGRKSGEKGTRYLHTLNGSGLAVGRTLVAVMETYQQPDGRIVVPEALMPYMGGAGYIE